MRRSGRHVTAALLAAMTLLAIAASGVQAKKEKKKRDPARRLYALKCAGACHRLYRPNEYDTARWEEILPDMAERAKLAEDEKATIREYLRKNAADAVRKTGK